MRNLFLLAVCIALLLILKEKHVNEKLERLDINRSEVIDFNGKLFLPLTIPFGETEVNTNVVMISIAGKNYRYDRKYRNEFYLDGESREVPVVRGDKVTVSKPMRLFFAREM